MTVVLNEMDEAVLAKYGTLKYYMRVRNVDGEGSVIALVVVGNLECISPAFENMGDAIEATRQWVINTTEPR